jgi:hypothetical protein
MLRGPKLESCSGVSMACPVQDWSRSKIGGDGGNGVYIREGTTSRVTAADRPYGKFYDFCSVSLETFGSTLVHQSDVVFTIINIRIVIIIRRGNVI